MRWNTAKCRREELHIFGTSYIISYHFPNRIHQLQASIKNFSDSEADLQLNSKLYAISYVEQFLYVQRRGIFLKQWTQAAHRKRLLPGKIIFFRIFLLYLSDSFPRLTKLLLSLFSSRNTILFSHMAFNTNLHFSLFIVIEICFLIQLETNIRIKKDCGLITGVKFVFFFWIINILRNILNHLTSKPTEFFIKVEIKHQ